MKKQYKLVVKNRDGIGRGPARRARAAGLIPGIIYGKAGTKNVSIDSVEFRTLMRAKGNAAALVELSLEDGSTALSLIKDFQRHPISTNIIHVDLQAVDPKHEMTAMVPVHFTGEAVGVKMENGTLDIMLYEVKVRCLPKDLPECVTVDISELHVNHSIHVSNLPKLDGVVYPGDQTRAVVVCTALEEEKAEDSAPVVAGGAAAPAAGAAPAAAADAKAAAPAAAAKAPAKK